MGMGVPNGGCLCIPWLSFDPKASWPERDPNATEQLWKNVFNDAGTPKDILYMGEMIMPLWAVRLESGNYGTT